MIQAVLKTLKQEEILKQGIQKTFSDPVSPLYPSYDIPGVPLQPSSGPFFLKMSPAHLTPSPSAP